MKSDKKGFRFNKNRFKEEVKSALKNRYRRSIEDATQQQLFQAVGSVIEEMVVDQWMDACQAYEAQQTKIVYYLSMEFLVGRALGNDLLNLGVYEDVKEAVLADYQDELEKEWVAQLRKKYKVEIDRSVLSTVNKHN